jgi:hypothetical protein
VIKDSEAILMSAKRLRCAVGLSLGQVVACWRKHILRGKSDMDVSTSPGHLFAPWTFRRILQLPTACGAPNRTGGGFFAENLSYSGAACGTATA